ncbi:DNA (cytosine-5-)-methyltransferase [Bacillus toyonensis]|uniref:DNA (cytosine-5-)-methyltransferase n=1 Tax=Bacillus toyonensis TaxID=155322 RepID=UPI003D298FD5
MGGFRLGMEQAGHKCLGYVEIDKFARKSYEAIHNTKGEWTAHDITTVTNDDLRLLRGQVDVICGGFPCQAFSIAGKRLGFTETRGTLFFEIARLAKEIQPQYLFLENVKGLLNHDSGNTFRTILSTLDELGYDAEWQLLNSKDYGVPQNRERVFIIGHLRGRSRREVFPIRSSYGEIGNVQRQQVYANTLTTRTGQANGTGSYILEREQHEEKIVTCVNPKQTEGTQTRQQDRVYIPDGNMVAISAQLGGRYNIVQPVFTPDRAEKRQNGRRIKEPGELMFTLTTQVRHGVLIREATKKGYAEAEIGDSINYSVPNSKTRRGRVGKGIAQTLDTACNQAIIENKPPYRIRRLTPRECWRLQGFPDWAFDRAQEVNSNSQLYKQAGNSVTVNVIHAIAERLV